MGIVQKSRVVARRSFAKTVKSLEYRITEKLTNGKSH